jgi:Fe2+ transport system protein B
MPYKPLFKNVALNVIEKQKHLFWCRIILAISIVLWFMAYGPGKNSITQKLYSFQNGKCRNTTRGTR